MEKEKPKKVCVCMSVCLVYVCALNSCKELGKHFV